MECQALTEEINKALGEVYETKATGEMYEQKVEIEVEATVAESWGSGSVRTQGSRPCGKHAGDCMRAHPRHLDRLCACSGAAAAAAVATVAINGRWRLGGGSCTHACIEWRLGASQCMMRLPCFS